MSNFESGFSPQPPELPPEGFFIMPSMGSAMGGLYTPYSSGGEIDRRREEAMRSAFALGRLSDNLALYRQMGGDRYTHFPEDTGEEYYQLSNEIATYAHDEGVGALVLVDKAARPAYIGFTEVWKAKYPDEQRPHINFMNRFGLQPIAEMSDDTLMRVAYEGGVAGINFPDRFRTEADIANEFSSTFTELAKHKDDPVLLLDTCLHSGESVQPILERLRSSGFTDVRLAIADGAEIDPDPVVRPDIILRESAKGGCYAFGFKDAIVVKTINSVLGKPSTKLTSREDSRRLRVEAREIIRDGLRRDGLLPDTSPASVLSQKRYSKISKTALGRIFKRRER